MSINHCFWLINSIFSTLIVNSYCLPTMQFMTKVDILEVGMEYLNLLQIEVEEFIQKM
ncbi:hypothetical protein HD554DRAFT_2168683 [Boletus coccyginus]|nr:hypothetical protein HD554DRAFT_2168683 [Boletus coccyginus]